MIRWLKGLLEKVTVESMQITYLVIAIMGIILIVIGWRVSWHFLMPIGGALFGSCAGALISRLANRDVSEQMQKNIEETQKDIRDLSDIIRATVESAMTSQFTSDEQRISVFRSKKWHTYHVTKKKGTFMWTHTVMDFDHAVFPGRLLSKASMLNNDERPVDYNFEAGMRDSRLLMFNKAVDSDEPCAVYVFPFFTMRLGDRHFGFVVHQTWDGKTHSISPTLLAFDPIEGIEDEGTVPTEKSDILDNLWADRAKDDLTILPRVFNKI